MQIHTHKHTGSAPIFTSMSVFCRSSSIYRAAYWYVSDVTIVKPAPGSVDVCQWHQAWFYQDAVARTENDSERSGDMMGWDPLALLMKLIQLNSTTTFSYLLNVLSFFMQCQMCKKKRVKAGLVKKREYSSNKLEVTGANVLLLPVRSITTRWQNCSECCPFLITRSNILWKS